MVAAGERIVTEFGVDMLTPPYLKWITNKDLLYSTRNSPQYSVMAYSGRASKKRVDIHICIVGSLCCSSETNTIF